MIKSGSKELIFVVGAIHGGGAERVVVTLANAMCHQLPVSILMVAGDEVAYQVDPQVNILSLASASGKNPLNQLLRLIKMRRYFKEHSSASVCSFSTTINMYTILSCLGLGFGDRLSVSERNDPARCSFKPLRNLIYRLGGSCKFVFQTSDARSSFSGPIYKQGVVIPNPIKAELPAPYTGQRQRVICAAGRLEPQKNHSLLLKAFSRFAATHPDYSLVIYGKGSLLESLQSLARELNIQDRVSFPGFESDIHNALLKNACYVLCSDYEGMPNGLMEAIATGVPSIATDCPIGGSREILECGGGLLIPMQDEKALSDALCRLCDAPASIIDAPASINMEAAASTIREKYSVDNILSLWREVWSI